ncbi:hypothetical protein DAT35_43965 [Vitiosangium sp. GDMCC 1.1324]|nr:hypothetical protein DAT35_43965 [Vitiosangium sp. GDMCC 1.1324]
MGSVLAGCGSQETSQPPANNTEINASEDDAEPEQATASPAAEAAPGAGTPAVEAPGASGSGTVTSEAGATTPSAPQLDADGVAMLNPSLPAGSSWNLGTRDPNTVDKTYFDLNGDKATAGTEAGYSRGTLPLCQGPLAQALCCTS